MNKKSNIELQTKYIKLMVKAIEESGLIKYAEITGSAALLTHLTRFGIVPKYIARGTQDIDFYLDNSINFQESLSFFIRLMEERVGLRKYLTKQSGPNKVKLFFESKEGIRVHADIRTVDNLVPGIQDELTLLITQTWINLGSRVLNRPKSAIDLFALTLAAGKAGGLNLLSVQNRFTRFCQHDGLPDFENSPYIQHKNEGKLRRLLDELDHPRVTLKSELGEKFDIIAKNKQFLSPVIGEVSEGNEFVFWTEEGWTEK